MITRLRASKARHRGVHRRRRASPHNVLPPATLLDVRMLIPFADPWESFPPFIRRWSM